MQKDWLVYDKRCQPVRPTLEGGEANLGIRLKPHGVVEWALTGGGGMAPCSGVSGATRQWADNVER